MNYILSSQTLFFFPPQLYCDQSTSRPESRESNNSRAMTRGSMIALNLLEQELGIDDTQNMDLDEFLESIVGKDHLKELDDEVTIEIFLTLTTDALV